MSQKVSSGSALPAFGAMAVGRDERDAGDFGVHFWVIFILLCFKSIFILWLKTEGSTRIVVVSSRASVEPSWRQILTDLARPTRRGGIVINSEAENDSK